MRDPVSTLLEAAALAGRSTTMPVDERARYGHDAVPPTLRCQECGRRIDIRYSYDSGDDYAYWVHLEGE